MNDESEHMTPISIVSFLGNLGLGSTEIDGSQSSRFEATGSQIVIPYFIIRYYHHYIMKIGYSITPNSMGQYISINSIFNNQ